jgi:hypothetical protein
MTAMLKSSDHLLSAEIPPGWSPGDYGWPEDELARFQGYMSSTQPLWEPPTQPPGAGHNQPPSDAPRTFQDDANAVAKFGTIVTSFKRLGLAIRDPRCHKPHLRVLYRFMESLNRTTGTGFPDRRTVAEDEGLDVHTVENVLYDLRKWGHIDWEKRADPRHKGRLLHYTLPVTRWTEKDIAQAVYALRESTRPNGYSKSPPQQVLEVPAPTGTSKQSTRPGVEKSTRPSVCSNLPTEPEERKGGADAPAPKPNGRVAMAAALGGQTAYAHRNIVISDSGKISLGEEFRAELREAYTDSQIERGLERAPAQVGGGSDLVKLLAQIRRCCSYAKLDDQTPAAKGGQYTGMRIAKR